jgi:hypothetical protein
MCQREIFNATQASCGICNARYFSLTYAGGIARVCSAGAIVLMEAQSGMENPNKLNFATGIPASQVPDGGMTQGKLGGSRTAG